MWRGPPLRGRLHRATARSAAATGDLTGGQGGLRDRIHRARLVQPPPFDPQPSRTTRAPGRVLGIETPGAVAILGLTATLTAFGATPPPPSIAPAGAGGSSIHATGSDFATATCVRLTATPGTSGHNGFVAKITDYDTGTPSRRAPESSPSPRSDEGTSRRRRWTSPGRRRAPSPAPALSSRSPGVWVVHALVTGRERSRFPSR